MKSIHLLKYGLVVIICLLACISCDTGVLVLKQETASVSFMKHRVVIDQNDDTSHPLELVGTTGSLYQSFNVYVKVDDPEQWLGDIYTIANPVYKAADHENGDHTTIYKALMGEGMLKAAILFTAGIHSSEDIEREITLTIIDDPEKFAYPNGNLYYTTGSPATMTVALTKMFPDEP